MYGTGIGCWYRDTMHSIVGKKAYVYRPDNQTKHIGSNISYLKKHDGCMKKILI